MAQITQQYTSPSTGLNAEMSLTAELIKLRLDTQESTPAEDWCIRLTGSGNSAYIASVNAIVEDCLDGRPSTSLTDKVWTRVDAATSGATAVIPVEWTTGFSAFDVVALEKSDGTYEFGFISAVSAGVSITVHNVSDSPALVAGFVQDVKIGDRILNLSSEVFGTSLGEGSIWGMKAQLEKPGTPTFVTADGGDHVSIDVTITAPTSDAATITYYDIYVSDTVFTTIPVGQEPDSKNEATITSAINVTTYGGSADARMFADDGVGGDISDSTFYVAVVAKTGTGMQDINFSDFTVSSQAVA